MLGDERVPSMGRDVTRVRRTKREVQERYVLLDVCSAKTTKPPYSSLSILVVVLVHLIVRSETALVA